jgi:hypothetical protein
MGSSSKETGFEKLDSSASFFNFLVILFNNYFRALASSGVAIAA